MPENAGIQFDRAEFDNEPARSACAECQKPLGGFYYDVNGQTVCEACRYAIETRFSTGSGLGRFVRATMFGLAAAALGFGIYYGIAALTGYEFGLIAIVVGFLVGMAVRIGSRGRGGWVYQTLAIALTYLAIVSTYIPPIVQGLRAAARAQEAQVQQTAEPAQASEPSARATPAAASGDTSGGEPADMPRALRVAIAIGILVALVCAAPFLAGVQNIIGLVIIGIGVYEAWKINRKTPLVITGPHTIAATRVEAARS